MPQRDFSYLTDIINAAEQIEEFIADIDKRQFEESALVQSAVIRQIEIIGEATKRLSQTFTAKHSDIPWRNIAGMRDILIHAYDHVDLDEVWNAVSVSIPSLMKKIKAIIADEKGK